MSQQQYRLLDDEVGPDESNTQLEKEQIYSRRDPTYRIAFFTILVLNAIAVLLWIYSIVGNGKDKPSIAVPKTILENLQYNVKVVFEPDERFENFSLDHGSEDPWQQLQPPGRGFIEIPEYKSLGGDLAEPKSNHYAISVFHQLHCLATLQNVFLKLTSTSNSISQSTNEHMHSLEHVPHCIDLLRQAIMCAADTSLEEALIVQGAEAEGLPTRGVTGWGVAHSCRDWSTVYEFAKRHRYRNDTGIL